MLGLDLSGANAGLVIRAGGIELLAMKGRKVTTRISVPFEGGEQFQLTQAIQRALEMGGVKARRLPVSILTQDVLFRFFSMPVVPRAELEGAVKFEARKYIPFKTESLVWDYHVVSPNATDKLEIVFAAVQRGTFAAIHTALTAAGVHPKWIEPRSVSLARLLSTVKGKISEGFVCLVDVERTTAHLAIVKDGVPYLARDVNLPPDTSSGTIEVGPAAGTPSQAPVADERAQRLLSELRVSVDFFTREYPSATVAKVLLFGEERLVSAWSRLFAYHLHCGVELGTSLIDQRVEGGLPLAFASAVGLLVGADRRMGLSIDFLRRSQPAKSTSKTFVPKLTTKDLTAAFKTPQAAFFAGLMGVVMMMTYFMGTQGLAVERRRLSHLNASKPDIGFGLTGKTEAELKPMKADVEAQLSLLKKVIDERMPISGKMDALVRTLPQGVWLTGVTFDDRPDASGGQGQYHLLVRGACFLGDAGGEVLAIQDFEDRVKRNEKLFKGFATARVDESTEQTDARSQMYRAFKLNCSVEKRAASQLSM